MAWMASTFESSVNPEGIQTFSASISVISEFESSVNPEGIQTGSDDGRPERGLRVV